MKMYCCSYTDSSNINFIYVSCNIYNKTLFIFFQIYLNLYEKMYILKIT